MADEGKPPSGRNAGSGRGNQRKAKFAPTVPSQRRKRNEEPGSSSAAATSAAEAAAANQSFQDLIRAAQTESKWQRGRGRGGGRGRSGTTTQVMFGGDGGIDSRRTAATPQPRALLQPKAEGNAAVKEAAGRTDGSARRLKPNIKQSSSKQQPVGALSHSQHIPADDASDGGQDLAALLDFEQYFPSTLPLSMHHPLDEEADSQADAAIMRRGLPEELALKPDDPEGDTAEQLGLIDLSAAEDRLYLFQLPSVLPVGVTRPLDSNRKGRGGGAAAAAASSSSSSQQPLQAAAAHELPSGQIGKLLVFQSGRVKLQMGSCLLDVSAGMPCISRQDVAAINKNTGHLIQLGPVTQRAVVCPDVWQLMTNQEIPQFKRDLQQQAQWRQHPVNGRGGSHDMELDDDLGEPDRGSQPVVRSRARARQVLDIEDNGEGETIEDRHAQQQQQQHQSQSQLPAGGQLHRSSSQGMDELGGAALQPECHPKQQQQPAQLAGNGALGWLDLPAAPATRTAAGRSKFRPSARSPSPVAAAVPPPDEAMDVDT